MKLWQYPLVNIETQKGKRNKGDNFHTHEILSRLSQLNHRDSQEIYNLKRNTWVAKNENVKGNKGHFGLKSINRQGIEKRRRQGWRRRRA